MADGASVLFFLEVVLVGPEGELIVTFCVVVPPRRAELTNRGVELFIRPRIDGLTHSVPLVIHTSQEEVTYDSERGVLGSEAGPSLSILLLCRRGASEG